jgi:enamine deaminase RidA (YjgF/YER057c/UK114 family)
MAAQLREIDVSNRFANPPTMPAPRGYTQVVETTGPGRTIYLSGQLGMTPDGAFSGAPGDFRAQAAQCFENLKAGLASVGAGFEHVVKITNFFVDMAHLPAFFEVRDRYVNTKAPPASTAIQIGRLAREGALFEVEAVAVIPDKAGRASRARPAGARRGKTKTAARKRR